MGGQIHSTFNSCQRQKIGIKCISQGDAEIVRFSADRLRLYFAELLRDEPSSKPKRGAVFVFLYNLYNK